MNVEFCWEISAKVEEQKGDEDNNIKIDFKEIICDDWSRWIWI
jgi:hypothetical protein